MDLAVIQAGLASVQSGIEITKVLAGAAGSLERAENKLKLAELMSSLADAKIALASAAEQISDFDKQLKSRNELSVISKWFTDGVYVIIGSDGNATDGPFCGRCFDVDSRLIRPANDRAGERGMGYCPECKNKYPLWNAEKRLIDDGVLSSYTG